MMRSDEQLMLDYRAGDTQAFVLLVERYLKSIYNFSYRLSGDAYAAEDITQDVFVKMWKNITSYRAGESVKAWLFTIARNTTIDYLRTKRPAVFSDFEHEEGNFLTDTLTDESPLPIELAIRAEDQHFIEEAFDKLSPLYREVMFLRYYEDLTFDEIRNITGRPLHTVKSQHRRGLEKLREYFEKGKQRSS